MVPVFPLLRPMVRSICMVGGPPESMARSIQEYLKETEISDDSYLAYKKYNSEILEVNSSPYETSTL